MKTFIIKMVKSCYILYLHLTLHSDIKSWEVGGDDVAAEVLGCNFLHFQLAN